MEHATFSEFFWGTVVPACYPHLGAYPKDLLHYDRQLLAQNPEMYYVLAISSAGTTLIPITDYVAMPPLEQKVAFSGAKAKFLLCPAANWICPIL